MASRVMHLAIANKIMAQMAVGDEERFKLGVILPDAFHQGMSTRASHLKATFGDGTKVTYKLSYFRETYEEKIMEDSLYLGYYMHLVQDMLYRQFVYKAYKWDPRPEGNIERLHNDYHLLNTYVVDKYDIKNKLVIPNGIEKEALLGIYPFDLERLQRDFQRDFEVYNKGETFFFTKEMADEYIEKATLKCLLEIAALKNGKHVIDEEAYAWDVH